MLIHMGDDTRWLDDEERAAWMSIAALTIRLPATLDADLQRSAGFGLHEYLLLAILSEQPERSMRMSELAASISSSLSRLSHTASRLERSGFVERRRCPGPGRSTLLTLTDAGMARLVEVAPGHVASVRAKLINVLDRDELATLGGLADRVVSRLDDDSSPCPG